MYLCACFSSVVTLFQLLFLAGVGWIRAACKARATEPPANGVRATPRGPGFTSGHRGASKEESLGLALCLNYSGRKAPRGYGGCRQHCLTGGTAGDTETLWDGVSC